MKRVLVTGAAGAFGPAVASRFNAAGYTVLKTDCRDNGTGCIIRNLRDRVQVESLLAETSPDLIIHLAGTLSPDFDEAFAVNVGIARMLLEAVERNKIRARVVLIGSAAEYGVVQPSENPLDETRRPMPVNIYGMTKAWQTMLMNFFALRGVDVLVARVFNLDGPGLSERLLMGRVPKLIQAYKKGEIDRIRLGPLTAIRDYVSFDEAVRQLQAIAEKGVPGGVYHVASGIPVSMREMVERCLAQHGLDMSIVEEDNAFTNHAGYDVPRIFAEMSRTRALLSAW